MATIILALLTIYEFFYLLENGGTLSFILFLGFVANTIIAFKVEKDSF